MLSGNKASCARCSATLNYLFKLDQTNLFFTAIESRRFIRDRIYFTISTGILFHVLLWDTSLQLEV